MTEQEQFKAEFARCIKAFEETQKFLQKETDIDTCQEEAMDNQTSWGACNWFASECHEEIYTTFRETYKKAYESAYIVSAEDSIGLPMDDIADANTVKDALAINGLRVAELKKFYKKLFDEDFKN